MYASYYVRADGVQLERMKIAFTIIIIKCDKQWLIRTQKPHTRTFRAQNTSAAYTYNNNNNNNNNNNTTTTTKNNKFTQYNYYNNNTIKRTTTTTTNSHNTTTRRQCTDHTALLGEDKGVMDHAALPSMRHKGKGGGIRSESGNAKVKGAEDEILGLWVVVVICAIPRRLVVVARIANNHVHSAVFITLTTHAPSHNAAEALVLVHVSPQRNIHVVGAEEWLNGLGEGEAKHIAVVALSRVHGAVAHEHHPRRALAVDCCKISTKKLVLHAAFSEIVLSGHDRVVDGPLLIGKPQTACIGAASGGGRECGGR